MQNTWMAKQTKSTKRSPINLFQIEFWKYSIKRGRGIILCLDPRKGEYVELGLDENGNLRIDKLIFKRRYGEKVVFEKSMLPMQSGVKIVFRRICVKTGEIFYEKAIFRPPKPRTTQIFVLPDLILSIEGV